QFGMVAGVRRRFFQSGDAPPDVEQADGPFRQPASPLFTFEPFGERRADDRRERLPRQFGEAARQFVGTIVLDTESHNAFPQNETFLELEFAATAASPP